MYVPARILSAEDKDKSLPSKFTWENSHQPMNEAALGTNSATEKTKVGVVWLHCGAAMASNHEVLSSVS